MKIKFSKEFRFKMSIIFEAHKRNLIMKIPRKLIKKLTDDENISILMGLLNG